MNRPETVLLIDDEAYILQSYRIVLRRAGLKGLFCHSAHEALEIIQTRSPDIILLDLTLKDGISGQELLPILREKVPEAPVIIISGNQDIGLAVECMKRGAHDYLSKPIDGERLTTTILRTLEWRTATSENKQLKKALLQTKSHRDSFAEGIVTRDHHMLNLLAYADIVAQTPEPVLITGASGVGKEMFARAIHNMGSGKRPWMAVNVTALDDDMFTDALFGHRRGAFTGAHQSRAGMLEKAAGGTLLLDEIGDLSMASQAKLLRLIQEKEYQPVGSDSVKRAECRIIVTTNRSLEERMNAGAFRSDLYYRLHVHHIHIPPLSERRNDIPLIAEHFVQKAAGILGVQAPALGDAVKRMLKNMDFPGNARQLEALIFDAVTRYKDTPIPTELLTTLHRAPAAARPTERTPMPHEQVTAFSAFQILPTISQARLELIDEAVRRSGDNCSAAARMLGITPQALHKHLKKQS